MTFFGEKSFVDGENSAYVVLQPKIVVFLRLAGLGTFTGLTTGKLTEAVIVLFKSITS